MEETAGRVTRLRRRLSTDQEETSSPLTPTKRRTAKLAAKPQLDNINENAVIESPKRTVRRSLAAADVEAKPLTPVRRSTRIKSNTSLTDVSESVDSPRAKRLSRRTSLASLPSDGEVSVPNTPVKKTRAGRASLDSQAQDEVKPTTRKSQKKTKVEALNVDVVGESPKGSTLLSVDVTQVRKSPRLSGKMLSPKIADEAVSMVENSIPTKTTSLNESHRKLIVEIKDSINLDKLNTSDPYIKKNPIAERKRSKSSSNSKENITIEQFLSDTEVLKKSSNKEFADINSDKRKNSSESNLTSNKILSVNNSENGDISNNGLNNSVEPMEVDETLPENFNQSVINEINKSVLNDSLNKSKNKRTSVSEDQSNIRTSITENDVNNTSQTRNKRKSESFVDVVEKSINVVNNSWNKSNSKENKKELHRSRKSSSFSENESKNNENGMNSLNNSHLKDEDHDEKHSTIASKSVNDSPNQEYESGRVIHNIDQTADTSVSRKHKTSTCENDNINKNEVTDTSLSVKDASINIENKRKSRNSQSFMENEQRNIDEMSSKENGTQSVNTNEKSVSGRNLNGEINSSKRKSNTTSFSESNIKEKETCAKSEGKSLTPEKNQKPDSLSVINMNESINKSSGQSKQKPNNSQRGDEQNTVDEVMVKELDEPVNPINKSATDEKIHVEINSSRRNSKTMSFSEKENAEPLVQNIEEEALNSGSKQKYNSFSENSINLSKKNISNQSILHKSIINQKDESFANLSNSRKKSLDDSIQKNTTLSVNVNLNNSRKSSISMSFSENMTIKAKEQTKPDTPKINKNIVGLGVDTSTPVVKDEKNNKKPKVATTKEHIEPENDSSDESYKLFDKDTDDECSNNKLIDSEAVSEDYESGDSRDDSEKLYEDQNEIPIKGETLGSSSENLESDSDYEKDSFVVSSDEEDNELLDGSGDDIDMSDNELSQSAKSKQKYNERKSKEQKRASREMYEARHGLDRKKKSESEESEEETETIQIKKQNKRRRLNSSVSSCTKDDEKEITIIDDAEIGKDPLSESIFVKNEPCSANVTQIEAMEQVQINEDKSMYVNKDKTLDPLQQSQFEGDDSESASLTSENEEVVNNYENMLEKLNNSVEEYSIPKRKNKSVGFSEKEHCDSSVVGRLNLSKGKISAKQQDSYDKNIENKENVATPQKEITEIEKETSSKKKKKNKNSSQIQIDNDFGDNKIQYENISNVTTPQKQLIEDERETSSKKKKKNKNNSQIQIDNDFSDKNIQYGNNANITTPQKELVEYEKETSSKKKKKNKNNSQIQIDNNSSLTNIETPQNDLVEIEKGTSSKKKKKNKNSSETQNENNIMETEFTETSAFSAYSESKKNSKKQKKRNKGLDVAKSEKSEIKNTEIISNSSSEDFDMIKLLFNDDSDDNVDVKNEDINKHVSDSESKTKPERANVNTDASEHTKDASRKRRRNKRKLNQETGNSSYESINSNKENLGSEKVEQSKAGRQIISSEPAVEELTGKKSRAKKRKGSDNNDEMKTLKIRKLPEEIINSLEDKPPVKSYSNKLVSSTSSFNVELVTRRKNKPSETLDESVLLPENPKSTKAAGLFKVSKKIKVFPSIAGSASVTGCTTQFHIVPLVSNKRQSVAVECDVPNFKEKYLYGGGIKRMASEQLRIKFKKLKTSKF